MKLTEKQQVIPALDELVESSSISTVFAEALKEYERTGKPNHAIRHNGGCPPVKVIRTICQLLETYPEDAIESVEIEGSSGCSDFRGVLRVEGSTSRIIDFAWDCAWRAREAGYKTFWGDPDQQRAAQDFGYRCFEVFEESGRG